MAEAKKSDDMKTASKPAGSTSASESSDPAVHQLLAERQTADMNDDKDEVRRIDEKIRELGYR